MALIASLLSLVLGLMIGFYGRMVYDRLNLVYEEVKERREAQQVGVVRVQGVPASRNQPIDLTSDTGGVRRMTPLEIENLRQTERARYMQENHQ